MYKKIILLCILSATFFKLGAQSHFVLHSDNYKGYIDQFNKDDVELYKGYFPNDSAWAFMKSNVPLLDCPDKDLELTYYFRWWTFRKHIKQTPDGFIFTEFLPDVHWAGKYNAISCAAAQHIYEGRWLKDNRYVKDYATFWLKKGGAIRSYSFWIADALWANNLVKLDDKFITDLLPDLVNNYAAWEKGWLYQGNFFVGKNPDGLFSQADNRDGMEVSIGGNGKRPTINSYMYGDAVAIAHISGLKGNKNTAELFLRKADTIKRVTLSKLWDSESAFFKTLPLGKTQLVDVRELHGYTPWYFNLPPAGKGYEKAWQFVKSDSGFYAPYGLTTAEQSHPGFEISYVGHECKWNGPSWPFATSVTLTAMANVLNNYQQSVITQTDYFKQMLIYAHAQRRANEHGAILPWIDEVINPYTGDWISRTILKERGWQKNNGGEERGKDYNHSSFCDLVITGLIGLRPQDDNTVIINPLIPAKAWDWFCLDNIAYHGKTLTIMYDKFGSRYGKGKGLMCFVNGELREKAENLQQISFKM
ncbi:MGH1-like glycoside hydrolase domain-containing protein [Mucilaginibacter aquaedulcis]|uniref:MGH1-like glycoside hydrolase domain-containing protein n=1 Tax=Mucilaginibacter aquaedulcis TaxID=1187081 RepID=UPI0025B62744|nr:glycosyl hydrolase family 65 protein [Mucilaginibacter aquaedulcis]MDN3548681.1 glycoside hydrolase [Mucilaginibacter aquaedulcis]